MRARHRPAGVRRLTCATVAGFVAILSISAASRDREPEPVPGATAVPAATAAPAPAQPSAQAAVGDEWTPLISQDFDTPAALGQFAERYPGWADYDTYEDTHKVGLYDSSSVVSVADGMLTEHLHTADGQPRVVSITPVPHVQTYGRYEIRFRCDVIPGYKIAWLLWPSDDDWVNGEIDFPEANLDAGTRILGFSHQVGGSSPWYNQWAIPFEQSSHDWHTAVVEWRPDSLTYMVDGEARTTTDPQAIPSTPMYWSMQTETSGVPAPDVSGDIQIDYVRAWAYQPGGPVG